MFRTATSLSLVQVVELAIHGIIRANGNVLRIKEAKTLKYRPNYQPKGFASLEDARKWCGTFVNWYRFEHHHSGIQFLTPAQRHAGKGQKILEHRHAVYEAAKAAHPERWNGRDTRDWSDNKAVYLNPDSRAGGGQWRAGTEGHDLLQFHWFYPVV